MTMALIIRKGLGKSQRQVERDTGIDRASLSRLENGKPGLGIKRLARLARYYGVPLETLAPMPDQRESA